MTRKIQLKRNASEIRERVDSLREVALALLDEVKSLNGLKMVEVKNGIDFDEEIKRFEIQLIQRALEQTGGNQLRSSASP